MGKYKAQMTLTDNHGNIVVKYDEHFSAYLQNDTVCIKSDRHPHYKISIETFKLLILITN
jgi:hypothetical protein